MAVFKCPVCKERHVIQQYDSHDYVCENGPSRISRKVFQDLVPTDLLSRNEPLSNRHSTKVDEARAATIENITPTFNKFGERIGTVKKNY